MPHSTDPLVRRTDALVARFRRQQPLRGGSLLVTILGDAIAPRGGVIALGSLIELARPFGITERHVRTAIGRLANDQWVSSQRIGRASFYTLTAHGRARFAEATQRIYGAMPAEWDGEWTLVILPRSARSARDGLREELTWLGFGQLTSGVFAHPTHRDDTVRSRVAELESAGDVIVIQRAVVTHASDEQLVAMGWDLGELARRYRRFIEMFAPLDAALTHATRPTGETAFVLRTLLVHEYRKIHLRDPQLPASLLPRQWAGTDAHELCRNLYAKVFGASEKLLSERVQTLEGVLPAPAGEIFARFGGLPRA
ncbi:MAG TPA: phenylacetic acid degradation operon negative regulatory protein PaaX [Steroidobacteraceae bacterium]|nr:phenylacetic acid degradation operon negative regulatory protein PaaX [Steroidobacteraceae bacterium]